MIKLNHLALSILILVPQYVFAIDRCETIFAISSHSETQDVSNNTPHDLALENSSSDFFPNQFPNLELYPKNENDYTQNRVLFSRGDETQSYEKVLPVGFIDEIKSLKEDDIWLDSGAATMTAVHDYFSRFKSRAAKVIAISPEVSKDTRNLKTLMRSLSPARFFPILGKLAEEVREIKRSSIALISDTFGAMAYSKRPDLVLKSYLEWLKVGGKIYVTMGKHSRIGVFKTVQRKTWFGFGKEVTETEWDEGNFLNFLKHIQGIKVQSSWTRGDQIGAEFRFIIEKTSEDIKVPELKLVQYMRGYPPFRRFTFTEQYLP